jgi:hypothetical protein
MFLLLDSDGYQIYCSYDDAAWVYEIYSDSRGTTWIGCADSIEDARIIAKGYIMEEVSIDMCEVC